MTLAQENGIIKKIVFRLARRYIAGPTTESMLRAVRVLNDRGIRTTVTLLNNNVTDVEKARYNTNAYMQAIRQISRLGLNCAISIRPTQLGYGTPGEAFAKNMEALSALAKSSAVGLWIEKEPSVGWRDTVRIYRSTRSHYSGTGIEFAVADAGAESWGGAFKREDRVKVRYGKLDPNSVGAGDERAAGSAIPSTKARLTIALHDIKNLNRMVRKKRAYKRDLAFEIPLGYNTSKVYRAVKGKADLSVYVPYGRDWPPYVINRIAEGRIRRLAMRILDVSNKSGEKNGGKA